MHRRKIPYREVSEFVSELEDAGATAIRRAPVDVHGLVEIRWAESELEKEEYAAALRASRPAIILSAAFAALVIAVILVVAL